MNEDIANLSELREGFVQYLKQFHSNLTHHDVICSDAFYISRYDIGISLNDVLQNENGIELCIENLKSFFTKKGRKNPYSDAHTYARAVKLLKEYHIWRQSGYSPQQGNSANARRTYQEKKNPNIPNPCYEEVASYIKRWSTLENYALQESALNKLFHYTYPRNNDMDDVLIKVSVLNDFYSTNIYSPYTVAKHIVALNIDDRLNTGDDTLVCDIAQVEMENGKTINFYSFATKYCSHHSHLEYPIYDSFVDRLLRYFRDVDGFANFRNDELKEYPRFKQLLLRFRQFYALEPFSLKEIDMYLWQLGKLAFPKNY